MSASRHIFKKCCTKYFNWAQMSSNLPEWDLQIYPRLVMCWYEEMKRAKSDISSLGVWLSNLFRVLSLRELLGLRRWEEKLYTNQRKLSRSALPQIDLEVGDYASMSVRFFLINVSQIIPWKSLKYLNQVQSVSEERVLEIFFKLPYRLS